MVSAAGALAERAVPMAATAPASGDAQARADALSALVNLGYGGGEAAAALAGIDGADEGAMIRAALRALAPKG